MIKNPNYIKNNDKKRKQKAKLIYILSFLCDSQLERHTRLLRELSFKLPYK